MWEHLRPGTFYPAVNSCVGKSGDEDVAMLFE
jgi:hypothetical protein